MDFCLICLNVTLIYVGIYKLYLSFLPNKNKEDFLFIVNKIPKDHYQNNKNIVILNRNNYNAADIQEVILRWEGTIVWIDIEPEHEWFSLKNQNQIWMKLEEFPSIKSINYFFNFQ